MRDLLDIVETLRSENGCPWDREQTLDSVKQHLVEECYETLEALDSGDPAQHREELGDLLLQIVLQAQIRREEGSFSFNDIVQTLSDKLVRRHPHVFGDVSVSGSEEVLRNWETIKATEKDARNLSSVGDVPRSLPALRKAHQVQARAARIGFERKTRVSALEDVRREFQNLAKEDKEIAGRTLGDLLFALVRLCRTEGVNAEDALNSSIAAFVKRCRDWEGQSR